MFTATQLDILVILNSRPDKEYHLSELGRLLGKCPGVFQRGINSLEKQGIIISHRRGNQRIFRINTGYSLYREIKRIVEKTGGAEAMLKKLADSHKSVKIALIYGSYARKKIRPDSDIDFLVAGDSSAEDVLLNKIGRMEKLLQREINYRIYSETEFNKKLKYGEPFLQEILSSPYILLKGKL